MHNSIIDLARQKVHHISHRHNRKCHCRALDHRHKVRNGEAVGDSREHTLDLGDILGGKEQPAKGYDMECKYNGGNTPPPLHIATYGLGIGDNLQPQLMQSKGYAVKQTPSYKCEPHTVP